MKGIILLLLCLAQVPTFGQSFQFLHPDGWGEEVIPFPIEFAPNIPYRGTEYLRFSPGWSDPTSEELWSYAFLWWVNTDAVVTKQSLEKYLKEYYSGLVASNTKNTPADKRKTVSTVVSFQEAQDHFEGTVSMLDYMSNEPIVLNVAVQQKLCPAAKHKAIFISVSPQPRSHPVWTKLNSLWKGFDCGR